MRPGALILGAAPRVAVAIARSLRACGARVVVGEFDRTHFPLGSNAVDHSVRLPEPDHAAFADALAHVIRDEHIAAVFPGSDKALRGLADNDAVIRPFAYPGCPPPDVTRKVLDKSVILEAARRVGMSVPQAVVPHELLARSGRDEALPFPIIAKPRVAGSRGLPKIMHFFFADELRAALEHPRYAGTEMLWQRYVPGQQVAIELIMRGGEPFAMMQHHSVRELPTTGGVSTCVESMPIDSGLAEQVICLLRDLSWEGVAMTEFVRDSDDGTYRLLEVNGRYWGCLALALQAGVDYPRYAWAMAHGRAPLWPRGYRTDVRSCWIAGELRRLSSAGGSTHARLIGTSRVREFVRLFESLRAFRPALWSWADPVPELLDCLNAVRKIVMPRARSRVRGRSYASDSAADVRGIVPLPDASGV